MKKCYRCKVEKEKSEFVADKRREDGIGSWCKECHNKRSATWYKDNKEQARECVKAWGKSNPEKVKKIQRRQNLKRKYGLTIEEYDDMLMSQGGLCIICHTDTPGGRGRFQVDHSHSTGKIRGLLCSGCNIAIGQMRENPEALRSAANYLEYHEAGYNARQ